MLSQYLLNIKSFFQGKIPEKIEDFTVLEEADNLEAIATQSKRVAQEVTEGGWQVFWEVRVLQQMAR